MKLIIDIDEETYNRAKNEPSILCGMNDGLIYQSNMKEAIANGTPIKTVTNAEEAEAYPISEDIRKTKKIAEIFKKYESKEENEQT